MTRHAVLVAASLAGSILTLVYTVAVLAQGDVLYDTSPILVLATFVLTGVVIQGYWSKKRGPWLTMFVLFILVFLVLAPQYQLSTEIWPGTTVDPPVEYVEAAYLAVGVGSVAWIISYMIVMRRRRDRILHEDRGRVGTSTSRLTLTMALSLGLVIVYCYVIGPTALTSTRDSLDRALVEVAGERYVAAIFRNLLTLPAAIALAIYLSDRNRVRRRLLALLLGVGLLLAVNPLSSPRILVGSIWGGIALAWLASYGPAGRRMWQVGFVLSFLYLFPFADYFRNETPREQQMGTVAEIYAKGDYDAFAQLLNALGFVNNHDLQFGGQFFGALFFWVPRSIWASKPQDSAVLIADDRGYVITNISMPVWGEGILNGGLLGVILLCGVFGALAGHFDRALVLGGFGRASLIIASFGAPYSLILLRGSLLQAVSVIAVLSVLSIVLTRFCQEDRSHALDDERRSTISGDRLGHSAPTRELGGADSRRE